MDLSTVWKQYLANWPKGLRRSGVVVTNTEPINFVSYLMAETVVMFVRHAPDSMGGRKVILPYTLIQAIKVTEPIGDEPFLESGFSESMQITSGQIRGGQSSAAAAVARLNESRAKASPSVKR